MPDKNNDDPKVEGITTLPWIPGLSPKLRKEFRKAGLKVVFKSGRNLKDILTSKNKTKLPDNSYPGIYKISCNKHPNNPHIGETKIQVRNRIEQHQDYVQKGQWENSGAAAHSKTCNGIQWDPIETIHREKNYFNRKVREALEIQYHKCGPENHGMNLDNGSYVKTPFWTPFFASLKKSKRNRSTSNNKSLDETNATSNR